MAPAGIPDDILFMCPNLALQPKKKDARFFTPPGMPFTPPEAASVLREMLALGLSFGPHGDLKLMAGQGWLEREEAQKRAVRPDENAALEAFAKTGGAPAGNAWSRAAAAGELSAASPAEQFKNAQKILLLAWEHENYISEINELESRIDSGNKKLLAALGEGRSEDDGMSELYDARQEYEAALAAAGEKTRPEYSWRIVVDAMAAFMPENAMLISADTMVYEDMRGMGILQPLPGDISENLAHWPEQFTATLLWANLPLWRALGYARLPQDRPWLGAAYDILVAARPPRP